MWDTLPGNSYEDNDWTNDLIERLDDEVVESWEKPDKVYAGIGKASSHTALKSMTGVVRIRRSLGSLEGRKLQLGQNLLDPDCCPKRGHIRRPRQNASDPRTTTHRVPRPWNSARFRIGYSHGDTADACCKSSTASLIISNPQGLQYPCQPGPTLTSSTRSPLLIVWVGLW
jgi:hypothetical protein